MTAILDLGASPAQVSASEIGADAGRRIRLTCAGDDPIFWSIGERAPETGMPGFRVARGASHEIVLPALPLWAWADRGSRLIATPIGASGETGAIPGETGRIVLGTLPIAIPDSIAEPGESVLAVSAGGGSVHVYAGTALPDPLIAAESLDDGQAYPLLILPGSDPTRVWAWTDRHAGATMLLTRADPGWLLA